MMDQGKMMRNSGTLSSEGRILSEKQQMFSKPLGISRSRPTNNGVLRMRGENKTGLVKDNSYSDKAFNSFGYGENGNKWQNNHNSISYQDQNTVKGGVIPIQQNHLPLHQLNSNSISSPDVFLLNNARSASLQKMRNDQEKRLGVSIKQQGMKEIEMARKEIEISGRKDIVQDAAWKMNWKETNEQQSPKNIGRKQQQLQVQEDASTSGVSNNTSNNNNNKCSAANAMMLALNKMMGMGQIELKYKMEPSKKSSRQFGVNKAYAANTNMGIFRNYNEDRVSIILSISKPFNKAVENWPKTSFFAVYDGHGGAACSDFLRDNLHLFIVRDENFPANPVEAIKNGIQQAESSFLQQAEAAEDRSGSCAIVLMILDDVAYTANVGDSRALISCKNCSTVKDLSVDHKPEDEQPRINAAGGRVYQSLPNGQPIVFQGITIDPPYRVFPGKLSVSRTIGDLEAKSLKHGGNPKVVISTPDIVETTITAEHDFIILACDGVFDRLNSQEVAEIFWKNMEETIESFTNNNQLDDFDLHKQCGSGIEAVMKETFERKSLDNITLVVIVFESFQKRFEELIEQKKRFLGLSQLKLFNNISSNANQSQQQQLSASPIRERISRQSDTSEKSVKTPLIPISSNGSSSSSNGKNRLQRIGSQQALENYNLNNQQQQQLQLQQYHSVPNGQSIQSELNLNASMRNTAGQSVNNSMMQLLLPTVNPQVTVSNPLIQPQQQGNIFPNNQINYQQQSSVSSNNLSLLPSLSTHRSNSTNNGNSKPSILPSATEFEHKMASKLVNLQNNLIANLSQNSKNINNNTNSYNNLSHNLLLLQGSNNNNSITSSNNNLKKKELESAYNMQIKTKQNTPLTTRRQGAYSVHIPSNSISKEVNAIYSSRMRIGLQDHNTKNTTAKIGSSQDNITNNNINRTALIGSPLLMPAQSEKLLKRSSTKSNGSNNIYMDKR